MAVVYFTNNASSGSGSLVEAIVNAQSGDVVRPDESVFERGSIIEIALASSLNVEKNLSFDGGPFRVRLNGGGAVGCIVVATGVVAEFTAFDFIDGVASSNGGGLRVERGANVVLSRCRVCGCDAAQYGGGIYVGDDATLTANDSAIFGNRAQYGGGVYVGDDAAATLNGATVCGNVDANAELDIDGETSTSALAFVNSILGNAFDDSETSGSVVAVALSSVGFVAPPPGGLTFEGWDANAWQNWDLRLLDDASPNPSPYRDSGDVGSMSRYDLEGNFRGRETNGVATCSPGAYETIQADLFWVGRDATGAEVVSPSFLTSDGWAASRFATVAGDVAPSNASSLFVGANAAFVDVIASSNVDVAIGGERRVEILPKSTMRIGALTIGASANIEKPTTHSLRADKGFRLGINVAVEAKIQVSDHSATNWSDVNTAVLALDSYSLAPPEPYYTTLRVGRTTSGQIFLDGAYECETFETLENAPGSRYATNVEPGTSIRCRTFNYVVYDTGKGFTNQVVVKLYGEATAKETRAVGATLDASDDFALDVTEATSSTLTLNGQTLYGDAPTCAVLLTGSARVDGADSLTVASLTFAEGAKVEFTNDASVILTTASATSATASGRGAFFAPIAAPVGLTLENGAVWGDASAGVTSLDVTPVNATTATFAVVKTNAAANIVAQYSDDDGEIWQAVETTAGVDEYELTVAQGADVTVRVATATGWLTDTVSTAPFLPVWTVATPSESVIGVVNAFEISTGGSNTGNNSYNLSGWGTL